MEQTTKIMKHFRQERSWISMALCLRLRHIWRKSKGPKTGTWFDLLPSIIGDPNYVLKLWWQLLLVIWHVSNLLPSTSSSVLKSISILLWFLYRLDTQGSRASGNKIYSQRSINYPGLWQGGGVAQWKSACFACMRPRVRSLASPTLGFTFPSNLKEYRFSSPNLFFPPLLLWASTSPRRLQQAEERQKGSGRKNGRPTGTVSKSWPWD